MRESTAYERVRVARSAIGLFIAAIAVRALPWPMVFSGTEGAFPFGTDAYYHLRRIAFSIRNFPSVLEHDSYIGFPKGGEPIWPPTLDWLLAAGLRPFVSPDPPYAMERIVVWVPPLFGALTVLALYFIARRYVSNGTALLSAALLCVLPAHFWYSQIGFVDHHVAVAFVTTLLFAAAARCFEGIEADAPRLPFLWLGGWMGIVILIWPGSILHVGIVEIGLVCLLLANTSRERAVASGRRFALANLVACTIVTPLSLNREWEVWGSLSPVVLTNFQPLFFLLAAIYFFALAEVWNRRGLPQDLLDRILHAAVLVFGMLGLSFVTVPELGESFTQSWAWFAKEEAFQAGVGESFALFAAGTRRPEELFSRAVYLAPLFFLGWAWAERRRPVILFVCGWGLALFIATLVQRRFMNTFSVVYALAFARAIAWGVTEARRRIPSAGPSRAGIAAAALVLFALLFQPVAMSYERHARNLVRVARGELPAASYTLQILRLREYLARWLRDHTPHTSGYDDPHALPEYAVLAPWSLGHVIKYVGRRPVLQDNFGDDVGRENFERSARYYRADNETFALLQLEGIAVRYVVARGPDRNAPRRINRRRMRNRLDLARGSEVWSAPKQDAPGQFIAEALSRHRVVFETLPLVGPPGEALSFYKVYEIVAGAEIVGEAEPNVEVVARLEIRPHGAAPFTYTSRTRTDSSGRYTLRLPYPTERFSPSVDVGERYQFESAGASGKLAVREADVQSGSVVAGPAMLP